MIYLFSIKNFKALVPLQLGVTKKMHGIKVVIKFIGTYKQNLTPCLLNLLLTALILIIFTRSFNSTVTLIVQSLLQSNKILILVEFSG